MEASPEDMILGTETLVQRKLLFRDTSRILASVLVSKGNRNMFPDARLDAQREVEIREVEKI